MTARRRIEIPTTGTDEFLQVVGSDPFGSESHVGLRVPALSTLALSTLNGSPQWRNRYLFAAASYSIGEGSMGRIIGYRQMVTIGTTVNVGGEGPVALRAVEQEVLSPFWHFPDANLSFHLRRLGPPDHQGFPKNTPGPSDARNFHWRTSTGPALLYETATLAPLGAGVDPFYVHLTGYTPPNAGKPWGTPLSDGHQGTFTDLRTQHRTHGAWHSLDIEGEGPDTITAFVSVAQTDPATRLALPASTPTFFAGGLSVEEQFLLNYPDALYWRVEFSLIVEIDGQRRRGDAIPDELKGGVSRFIAPQALFWFRWGAMATIGFGLILAALNGYLLPAITLDAIEGFIDLKVILIGIGMWLGSIMWFNVWFIIWPNQQKALNIGNAYPDLPAAEKAKAARTAGLFSRTNTMLSVPMLFCMVAAPHLA